MSSFIDTLLHRQLQSGREFEGLIPKSEGTQQYFEADNEYSDTYETLAYMALWAYAYAHQMKKVAPLLLGATISETVENVYKWLYHHFQYKIDGQLQHLYAPSAAWENRVTGFDCKTYSLLASTILQCLSIPHAFRKVKQPGMMPNDWTHVYVIVPTQNNKYLIIDATTHNNKEVSFIEKYDYTMKLKHVGLASPAIYGGLACPGTECTCGQGLASAYGGYDFDMNTLYTLPNAEQPFGLNGSFNMDNIKSLFSQPLSCYGGTSYDATRAKSDIEGLLARLHSYIDKFNLALQQGDTKNFALYINKFIGTATWNASVAGTKRSEGWQSACTAENLKITHETYNFYRYTVTKALDIWLKEYFTSIPTGTKRYGRVSISGNVEEAYFGEWATWVGQDIVFDIPLVTYYPILSKNIPAFEVTKFIYESNTNITALTPQTVLSGLQTVIVAAQQYTSGSNNPNTPITDGGTYDGTTGEYIPAGEKPKTSMAGTGLVVGCVLAYAGYKIMTSKATKNAK
ncbi:hypothetical protein FLJC2902T_17420 [Flavobacterium limnosediminis JC2902]|uniref:Transglutaminase-like domain-containing protein n=1 Tax=Flavobacterium limnosediminis JC2902 TaxID=1341181 RepID=V6SNW5_9FLAO|nr:hypothetical protein [Flavobacterium limnosediminis]ESU28388.1 hypothetical protein FLJC2902T_17420 [Flavobacterium limnosediminis JC2902]